MLDVLNPFDIPVYLWEDGEAKRMPLDSFERTPLVNYYLTRNYKGRNEPMYHLCDEPFDYSSLPGIGWMPRPQQPEVQTLADCPLFGKSRVPIVVFLRDAISEKLSLSASKGSLSR